MSNKKLTPMEIDAVGEILNISLGSSATAASTMLNTRVDITTPTVEVKTAEEFEFTSLEPAVGVEITYVEGLEGCNVMLLKRMDVKVIVEKMMGMEIPDEEFELNELNISAICEVMNQMMGASATALAELLSKTVNISTPVSFEIQTKEQLVEKYFDNEDPTDPMVIIRFNLKIGDEMQSQFMNVMPIPLAKSLVSGFFPDGAPDAEPDEGEAAPASEPAAASEPEPAPASEPAAASDGGGDKVLDQAAIEALLASTTAEASASEAASEPAAASEPESAPASEPAAASDGGGDKVLDQAAIEALLASTTAEEPASEAAPEPKSEPASAQAAQPQAATPQPQPAQTATQPQAAAQPQAAQAAQPQAAAPVTMAVDPNAMAANSMMMQQMMDMMRQQMELQRQELEELRGMYKQAASPKQIKVNPMPAPTLGADEAMADPDANLDLIMGVPLDVSVEIGRTKKLVRDILEFNKGSLIVLNKLAGEQVDIFVNGQCIAKGDVVVVEDNFGVRITEILQEEIVIEQQG